MSKIAKSITNKKLIIALLALFVTISFSLSLNMVTNSDIKEITDSTGYITKMLLKLNYSLDKNILESIVLFICLNFFFQHVFFKEKQKRKVFKIILALIFSFFMVFGYSYIKANSWELIFGNTFQLFKAIIKGIGYYILFRAIINYLFDIVLQKLEIKETTNKIYNFIFVKHSFIMPLIIILICWLPYIVSLYPGVLFQDSTNQIKQYFGYDVPENSSTNSVNLIDENVKITNHHPVVHTVILGLCMQFGKLIGNDNIGLFTYSILQVLLLASTFAYVINFMKKLKIPNWFRTVALLIFALLPIIPIYAMEVTKDVPFTCFVILYVILIYKLIKNANTDTYKVKDIAKIIILSMLVILFRNNGIYVIIMSLPFIAIIDKINRKAILIISVVIVALSQIFNSVILPALKITPSSVREALCIPFQQTARYVRAYGDEVTTEQKQAIDKVLDYSTLAERYDPTNADAVKNKYNKDATTEDLVNYLKVWFTQFFKHPTVYLQATFNNAYGYFYPESNSRQYAIDYVVDAYQSINDTGNFNYHYIDGLRDVRVGLKKMAEITQKVPPVSWITNVAINVWIIIFILFYLLYSKKYRYIIYVMPLISIILVCIASPINVYFRYTLPYVFGMPLTVAVFIDILKNNKKEERVEEK